MSTTTARLGLYKYQTTDPADLTASNPNADTLDMAVLRSALGNNATTSTAALTLVTFTPTSQQLLLVVGGFNLANGTSGNNITFKVAYTESSSGLGKIEFLQFMQTGGSSFLPANGANSFVNNVWIGTPIAIWVAANQPVTVTYQDPTNTPNDSARCVVARLS